MIKTIKKFFKEENAVASIEYALIACLIALAIISAVFIAGHKVDKVFKEIAKLMDKAIKRSKK
ncbi:MAG: Flp family type IVb pilin [bacterium]